MELRVPKISVIEISITKIIEIPLSIYCLQRPTHLSHTRRNKYEVQALKVQATSCACASFLFVIA